MPSVMLAGGSAMPEPMSLPEIVYRKLRDAILNGVYAPGAMLRQEEVAAQLGVSRNPLREALPRLESEGIVVLYPRRGYAVVKLDPTEICNVFDLRILLETDLVARSVVLKTKADEQRVQSILDDMALLAEQAEAADRTRWFDLNLRFHDAMLLPARCPHHMKALAQSRGALEAYIRAEVRLTGDLNQAQREHAELTLAFISGDKDRLIRLIREHSEHTRDRLLRGLPRWQ
ncbi:GntR family transcriptional regulator [Sodalis ligni]|uniref:DNA-binding GntR family transcriptional regulator n=1 Tax=Sodalis ligni TaxID=2697027 RepID=A0A4R1NCP1_9GAMM|nr:GntR family transcriptional regulator [Sodalis ligni]TCL05172.1 DNA-binding GntR family transcriptional regulator [Sodalis ligni]